MKKIAIVFVMMCSFLFAACQMPPEYAVVQSENGEIVQTFVIPFEQSKIVEFATDETQIAKLETAADNITAEIVAVFDNYFANMHQSFVDRIALDASISENEKQILIKSCPSATELKLLPKITASNIVYSLEFSSAIAYYYYTISTNKNGEDMFYDELKEILNKDDRVVSESFFVDKYTSTNQSVFGKASNLTGASTLGQYIINESKKILEKHLVTAPNNFLSTQQTQTLLPTSFVYTLGTPNAKLHSDADEVHTISGITYHVWEIKNNNLEREITTYTLYANANVWYALALVVTLVLVLVLFIVNHFKTKNKNAKVVEE